MFGISARELQGRPIEVLLPERFRAAHVKARTTYAEAPTVRAMSARSGLTGLRADGSEFPVEVSLTPILGSPDGAILAMVRDVGARSRLEAAMARDGRAIEALDAMPDAVLVTDASGGIELLNRAAEELTGYHLASARGLGIDRLLPAPAEAGQSPLAGMIAACLAGGPPVAAYELSWPPAYGGHERTLDVSISPLRRPPGDMTGAAVIVRDVTHARRMAKALAHQATHDALTGLVNRREFERRLTRAVERAAGGRGDYALCFLDLDGFKRVNDASGHLAGDELLRELSGVMRDRMRARDTLARLGGDEFGVLLEHCGLAEAARIADEIREAVATHVFTCGEATYPLGVSIGVVAIRGDRRPGEILRAADTACYAAKRAGGNRVQVQ